MRDIAKWMTGGVVATAAAVATGASLTNLGSLSLDANGGRLAVAIGGLTVAVLAIGVIVWYALRVFTNDAATIDSLIEAEPNANGTKGKLYRLKEEVEVMLQFERYKHTWDDLKRDDQTNTCPDPDLEKTVTQMLGFINARMEFLDLQKSLYPAGFVAMCGFVTFAWAANPPEPKEEPAAPTMEVVEFEYDSDGNVTRQTTRNVKIPQSELPSE